jgi:hypothetical protein
MSSAVYYTTGTTDAWMAAAVIVFAAWTLWRSRHYRTPAQIARERAAQQLHPSQRAARCAVCGWTWTGQQLERSAVCLVEPCERCLFGESA